MASKQQSVKVKSKKMTRATQLHSSGYDKDFYAWTLMQSQLLRDNQFDKIDIEHLIEEIEFLGKSDKRALKKHLINLLLTLLKIKYQPKKRTIAWNKSALNARLQIALICEDSPSLKKTLSELIGDAYRIAREEAATQTKLPIASFPVKCPWKLKAVSEKRF